MNTEGIVYFIQPTELINTNKYKIGMSRKNDLSRLKSYHKGTRFISIMSCNNPLLLEGLIKNKFQNKYKLIAGNEYFEGDEKNMLNDFLQIIDENKNLKELENKEIIFNNLDKEIKNKKNLFCKICNKNYASLSSISNHNRIFHSNNNLKIQPELKPEIKIEKNVYSCRKCKKIFTQKQNRWRHEQKCDLNIKLDENKEVKDKHIELEKQLSELRDMIHKSLKEIHIDDF